MFTPGVELGTFSQCKTTRQPTELTRHVSVGLFKKYIMRASRDMPTINKPHMATTSEPPLHPPPPRPSNNHHHHHHHDPATTTTTIATTIATNNKVTTTTQ